MRLFEYEIKITKLSDSINIDDKKDIYYSCFPTKHEYRNGSNNCIICGKHKDLS